MTLLDFTIEFDNHVTYFDELHKQMVEDRLRALADERNDIIGAAVAVEEEARETDPFLYKARIVVYMKPDYIAANKKDDTIEGALKQALDAIERQVREQRKKLREPWKRPDYPGSPQSTD